MALASDLVPIEPATIYPVGYFHKFSGISYTRTRDAKREHGIEIKTLRVGKRLWIRGSDAIAFIEALAALPKADA